MPIKLPVSFEQFVKNPLKAITYLFIIAIVALFIRTEAANQRQINTLKDDRDTCRVATYILNVRLDQMSERYRRTDSLANSLNATLKTLRELGAIKIGP